ncbi:hypothetical protein HPB50_000392 [Hyalomma asiaticum]|uniref:Uncharacterized protein n=1 Tax=Hyalomma asiaticum TaxID=266040 RepID=A0ACB7SGH2_HYAAI|nr:hypothetical protein HPB50_000392 [Hyalomma asiaticum]
MWMCQFFGLGPHASFRYYRAAPRPLSRTRRCIFAEVVERGAREGLRRVPLEANLSRSRQRGFVCVLRCLVEGPTGKARRRTGDGYTVIHLWDAIKPVDAFVSRYGWPVRLDLACLACVRPALWMEQLFNGTVAVAV